jgi:hypothetical protein
MQLQTGGKGNSKRQNLFTITASAVEYRSFWGATPVPINSTDITVGDLGRLGSDGLLHIVLDDNTTRDATVQAPKTAYSFTVGQQKHKLYILANDTPLTEDRVAPLAKYCVGQYIGFSPMWRPVGPPGISKQVVQWNFDGDYVNDSWQLCTNPPDFPVPIYYGSVNYTNNPAMLTNENTHAWWVSGGPDWPGLQYLANLNEKLTFSNGQTATLSRQGLLDMYRPSLVNWAQDVQVIVTNYTTHLGLVEEIHVGTPTGDKAMGFHVYVSSSYPGMAGFTQTYDDQSYPNNNGSDVLDAAEIYPNPNQGPITINPANNWTANMLALNDRPYEGSTPNGTFVSLVLQFRDYARFMPSIGGPNIYITLGKVTWNVNATATYTNGAWVLNPGSPVVPSWGTSQEFPSWVTVGSGH